MLQRQIMYKQLQELERRKQLQDFSGARDKDYVDQLSSLKQASPLQFAPTINGAPIHDSQMLMVDNTQTTQHDESSVFEGFPCELVLSQNHSNALGHMGLSSPQFDISLYGTPAPNTNTDKNSSMYPHFPLISVHSANLLTKNRNDTLGSTFMSGQGSFSSDQVSMQDGSLLPNQVFHEKNMFGRVPFQGFNNDLLSVNYSPQGTTMQESEGTHEETGWPGISEKVSKIGISEAAASLDPLEQKILYSTDDHSWGSSFGLRSKLGTGGFECTVENPETLPSIQSGSWSALMQSAVTETSSSDTAIQEEWSGLSFQNPEPSSDYQPSSFINSEKPQNNWVDRNLQNVSSPNSEPEQLFDKSYMNYRFPGFQQSRHQYLKQRDEFQSESSQNSPRSMNQLVGYNSQLKHPTGRNQLVQTSLHSENPWPAQYHEMKDALWLHGSTSNSMSGDIQTPFDQLHQLNIHRYSVASEKREPGENVEPVSALLGASSDLHCQNLSAQRSMHELLKKDDISNGRTPGMQLNSKVSSLSELSPAKTSVASFAKQWNTRPESQGFGFALGPVDPGTAQSYSLFPSLSMGHSSMTSLPSNNEKDYIKNQHPVKPVPSHTTTKHTAYGAASSQVHSQLKTANSIGPDFSLLENTSATQPSRASVVSQHVGFPTGLPTPWPDSTTLQGVSSPRANKYSSSVFRSHSPASSSRETSSEAPMRSQNCFKPEHNAQEFGRFSGKSGYHEQRSENINCEGSTEMHNLAPLSSTQQFLKKHYSEEDGVTSGSLMTHTSQQLTDQAEQKDDETSVVPAVDIRAFGHSLHQNSALLHQFYPRNEQTDSGQRFPLQYGSIHSQQAIAKARDLFLSGHKFIVKDKPKSDLEALEHGAFSPGDDKGWNLSQEAKEDQLGKASSAAYLQNYDSQNSIGSNEASNVAYQSQISLQMAPSWFKHYGNLKNGQVPPMYNPIAAITAAQPFSGSSTGNLLENSLILQVNSADASQGSDIWPSSAATLTASKHLSLSSVLPSDSNYQNFAVPKHKKRKVVAFDMVPWHKEINCEALRLQNISMAEFEWVQASNKRQEEYQATNEADIVDGMPPAVGAKRRLTFTTQLMQQVFRPAPAGVLFADASSNCDYLAYSAARLALGDACNLNSKLPSDTNDVSPDKLKTLKRTTADFSKVVECVVSRVKKLEGDLSRLDHNLSIVDIKVESQELDKFSTLNCFAKFHIKAHPSSVDPASSSGRLTVQKATPRRYVIAVPMPKILPEGIDCLSL